MNAGLPVQSGHVERGAARREILVWDAPTRVFHWMMVLCFAGAYLTAEQDDWRLVHVTLGYTLAGLVVFRILWDFVGTRYARFSSFVRGPGAAARYLGSLAHGTPEHHTGHNPAGGLVIVAMLALAALVALTGWATYRELAGEALEEVHEVLANLMLALVGIHVAGVLVSSRLHRENLVRAMLTGRKEGAAKDGVARRARLVAVALLAAVVGFWWLQWEGRAEVSRTGQAVAAAPFAHARHDDD